MTEREVFVAAIEIEDRAARQAYVVGACGPDDALRVRVNALLETHDQAGSFLDSPPSEVAQTVDRETSERPGVCVGPYKLLQELGEGGMGTVYLAEQTQPLQRKVALKIIKPGMDSRQVIARFEAERQALALMDHPNIAKVLDAGATHTGRPYFVMELVKGIPITTYCDEKHFTIRERLELMIPVCQAVQHAHQKGLIHRDLKPSNVLIALYDGRPVPKIIDFGVAKATAQRLTERTMFTEVGAIVGTLEYMAPEQAELNNLDIDTRADIYSLGVILYELFTGSPPFTSQQLRSASFDEMLRMIREVEPLKPSTKLSSADELPSIAAHRMLEPKKLTKLVHGDLDWIVMKCLEKERSRRYETANGLGQDLNRYLANEPVFAGPPSARYRLRTFARRHNRAFLLATAFAAMLVIGVVVSTWLAVQATRATADAVKQRNIAIAAAKAERLAKTDAEHAGERARKEADWNRRLLYDADMQLAAQLWQSEVGTSKAVADLLDAHIPKDKEDDLRDFAWRYQRNLLRSAIIVEGHQGRVFASLDAAGALATLDSTGALRYWNEVGSKITSPARTSHFENRRCSAISSDGTTIAIGFPDGAVVLSEVSTGRQRVALERSAALHDVAFSGDGTKLVSVHSNGKARLWDVATGALLETISATTGDNRLQWLALSPNGKTLVLVNHPANCQLSVLSFEKGSERILSGHTATVRCAEFSADGKTLASCDGHVILWDTATWEEKGRVYPKGGFLSTLAFSRDGGKLALGGSEGLVTIWDVAERHQLGRLKGHTARIAKLAFSADGARLVSGSDDGTARVWDVAEAPEGRSLGHGESGSHGPTYSPDGKWLATCGAQAKIWDTRTEEVVHVLDAAGCATFCPKSQTLATAAGAEVKLWDVDRGQLLRTLEGRSSATEPDEKAVAALAFSPNGKLLAAGFGVALMFGPDHEQNVQIWDAQTGEHVCTLPHSNTVPSLAFFPDGKVLATACHDGKVRLWDVETWQQVRTLQGLAPWTTVAVSPILLPHSPRETNGGEGYVIAAGSWNDQPTQLWDGLTGKLLHTLSGHANTVFAVIFSPDGKTLASASFDRTIKLWDVVSGRELRTLAEDTSWVLSLAFSPDGATLASSADRVRLWETRPVWDHAKLNYANWHAHRANSLQKNGDVDGAVASFRQAIKLDPKHAVALKGLGDALRAKGDLEGSVASYREAVENSPTDLVAFLDLINALLDSKDWDGANTWSRKAIEVDPTVAWPYSHLGWGLYSQGDVSGAIASYRRAIELDPKYLLAYYHLAEALLLQGKVDEAIACFRQAVEVSPEDAGAHMWLGWGFFQSKNIDGALAAYRRAVELDPNNAAEGVSLAAVVHDAGNYVQAETMLRVMLQTLRTSLAADDPQIGDALAHLTRTLLAEEKFAEAELTARECLDIREEKAPDDWRTFYIRILLGESLLGQKMYDEAEPLLLTGYEEMIQREDKIPAPGRPRLKEAMERLVQLYEALDQPHKAAPWKERLAEFDQIESYKKASAKRP